MASHEKGVEQARRRARLELEAVGREVRSARLAYDLSQAAVARGAHLSASTVGRVERGAAAAVSVADLAGVAAVVGLDLRLRAYPGGDPLRDASHVRLLERLHKRLGRGVTWRTEVPLPLPGDRRAWDACIGIEAIRVGVEAETRARDAQELQRRLSLKRRDGDVDHVVLLLADTRNNRGFVRSSGAGFRADYPIPGPLALKRLAVPDDPGGNAIILL